MKPFSTPPTAHDKPLPGFSHSRAQFEALVDSALAHAKRLGASDAAAQASEGLRLSESVRKGELENVERNRDKSLGITVYVGHRRAMPVLLIFLRQPLNVPSKPRMTSPVSRRKTQWRNCRKNP